MPPIYTHQLFLDDPDRAHTLFWDALMRAKKRRDKRWRFAVKEMPPAGMIPTIEAGKALGVNHQLLNAWARGGIIDARKYPVRRGKATVKAWHVKLEEVRAELESGRHPQVGQRNRAKPAKRVFPEPPEGMMEIRLVAEEIGVCKDTLRGWIRSGRLYGKKFNKRGLKNRSATWFVWLAEAKVEKETRKVLRNGRKNVI